MKDLKEILLKEEKRLEGIVLRTKKQMEGAPEGSLRVSVSKNGISYYHYTDAAHKNGKYISRKNKELIQKLAQKEYDRKVLRDTEKKLRYIKLLVNMYESQETEDIFYREHPERKKWICPAEPIWEERVREWQAEVYQGKHFEEENSVIYTEKGERVRSKSEKILADYFYRHGIPYKYERPLYLEGFGIVYPDFTILSRKTGEEIYWEHNGKMDDPVYARSAVKKIETYEKNNIFPGEKLILTYETDRTVLHTKTIERLAKKYLL